MKTHKNTMMTMNMETKIQKHTSTGTSTKVESDYQRVRKQFYDLAEQGDEAIDLMLELARESEHPRAFEVLGQLIKNNAEIGEKILKLHKSKKEQDEDSTPALTQGATNNNVFIGSTAELQKMLRDEKVIDNE
jgi:lipopolysaccharide biosynthesis regulator YciM